MLIHHKSWLWSLSNERFVWAVNRRDALGLGSLAGIVLGVVFWAGVLVGMP